MITAALTFNMIKVPSVTPTRASASVSLFLFFIFYIVNSFVAFDYDRFCILLFGASFVGMCSHKVFNDLDVVVASLIYTGLFLHFSPENYGLGGALGFMAFVSIFVVWILLKPFRRVSHSH